MVFDASVDRSTTLYVRGQGEGGEPGRGMPRGVGYITLISFGLYNTLKALRWLDYINS